MGRLLSDAASGQGPDTLARKLSRCKPACRQAGRVWHACPRRRRGVLPDEVLRSRVSGCNGYYKFVLVAGAKAKTVTSNLPILSVLGGAIFLLVKVLRDLNILMS